MDRFLKRLRSEPAIPEEVYARARQRAWARIQSGLAVTPPRRSLKWGLAALIPAAALAAWLLVAVRVGGVPPAPPPVAFVPVAVAHVQAPAAAVHAALRKPVRRSTRPAPRHERLVLNFVLPDSGVRMIWIMDSEFKLDGDNE
jgi:hypothetical protein